MTIRLADALATAGGISQFNISYVFVSRSITGQEELAPSSEQQENQQQYAPPVETPAYHPSVRAQAKIQWLPRREMRCWR